MYEKQNLQTIDLASGEAESLLKNVVNEKQNYYKKI